MLFFFFCNFIKFFIFEEVFEVEEILRFKLIFFICKISFIMEILDGYIYI